MRAWLLRAPWWAYSLFLGVFYGLGMMIVRIVRGDASWPGSLVHALVIGAFFGLIMGPFMARMNRRLLDTAGEEHADRLSRTGWGRRPERLGDDPELRAAARRVAMLQRDQLLRQRRWAVPFFVLLLGLDLWLAVVSSPWFLLAGLVMAAFLVGHLLMPRRLERRAELLQDRAG